MAKLLSHEQRYDIGGGYEAECRFDGDGRLRGVRVYENAPNGGSGMYLEASVVLTLAKLMAEINKP